MLDPPCISTVCWLWSCSNLKTAQSHSWCRDALYAVLGIVLFFPYSAFHELPDKFLLILHVSYFRLLTGGDWRWSQGASQDTPCNQHLSLLLWSPGPMCKYLMTLYLLLWWQCLCSSVSSVRSGPLPLILKTLSTRPTDKRMNCTTSSYM